MPLAPMLCRPFVVLERAAVSVSERARSLDSMLDPLGASTPRTTEP